MIARARDTLAAQALIAPMEEAILARLAPYVWGYDDETPEQAVGQLLKARGLTLATMESGTGGYLANSITESPDSAEYFKGGVVVSNPAISLAVWLPCRGVATARHRQPGERGSHGPEHS